jgi:adenine C2-methylase RlmN of 23S rRNA A2503 and tRNA A37
MMMSRQLQRVIRCGSVQTRSRTWTLTRRQLATGPGSGPGPESGSAALPAPLLPAARPGAGQSQSQSQSQSRHNFYSLSVEDLSRIIRPFPQYRSKQIWHWVYEKGVVDFSAMVNIPRELQENLQKHITFGSLTVEEEQVSRNDSTVKRAYKLWDGQLIESVLMPYEDGRQTACISSQAGCAMGCVFCATGQMGFSRQLSSSEIFEQAAKFAVELRGKDKRLSNIVLMGMGEPLNNYKNVMHAISRINKELGIGARHITLSTVGIVPKIKCLADENMQVLFLCVLPSPIP